ncbi:glycosyltransferase [soil metagenome]
MDILQLITDTDRRGAQVFALDLHESLRALGHRVDTVALRPGAADASLAVEVLGARRWALDGQLALRRRAGSADVVIAHGSSTAAASTVTLGRTRTPVVYRQISDSAAWASSFSRRARVRLYLSQMAHVVALWSGAARVLTEDFGVPADRVTVVPNGVRAQRFLEAPRRVRAPEERLRLAYLGALTEEKGVEDLVWLAGQRPDLDIVAAGDGPLLASLRADAPANLELPGVTDDPVAFLAAADAFVFPSRWGDSMPAAIIEAGLAGLPAVVTDVGAASELVLDGTTGFVVPPADRAALAAAVGQVVGSASLRAAMADAARAHAVNYDMAPVAERWERVLRGVLEDRSSR